MPGVLASSLGGNIAELDAVGERWAGGEAKALKIIRRFAVVVVVLVPVVAVAPNVAFASSSGLGTLDQSYGATVGATSPVPIALIGTFTRGVTAANVRRTQAFRHEPADEVLPAGVWRLQIARDGVITFDDPDGSGGDEAFTATPGGMLILQGPANWLLPPDRQGGFCGLEPIGVYSWATGAGSLVLTPRRDSCADRNSMFTGTWGRT